METLTCANCGFPASALDVHCSSCGGQISSAPRNLERTAPASRQPSLVGQRLSHYEVQERLGAGGMGVVYRAVDVFLGRSVALKVLAPQLADDEKAKARFIREARSASALDHPNIGTIYEIGEHQSVLFIAMALYEGETLRERLRRGPLPAKEALAVLRQMALGLAAAHAAGLVHRDIKPGNVMLASNGTVKLLDFGLAKLIAERQSITVDGETVGTLLYTAPEQLRGERLDHRADLWSLGTVAYEMLSGVPPFRGDSPASTTLQILSSEPAPLVSVPGVSSQLAAIVSHLLDKKPENRIQSAAEIIRYLDDGSTATTIRVRWPRRRLSLVMAVLAGTVGAGIIVAVTVAVTNSRPREPNPKPPPNVIQLLRQEPLPSPAASVAPAAKDDSPTTPASSPSAPMPEPNAQSVDKAVDSRKGDEVSKPVPKQTGAEHPSSSKRRTPVRERPTPPQKPRIELE